ncbi:MAG: macro domain-containing protein [Bacteroidetes bacterium]|nr:macro domain-containing protein [Bacteroidota bacterium]
MVRVLIGDIFNSKAQTLVNTVNTVGIMGKGLALEFKKRFPDMFQEYVQQCKKGDIKLGKPYLYKTLLPPWILLFPTKENWRSVSKLSAIETGLEYLKENYKKWGITSIAVPPLGCGLGELEWNIVGRTLYHHLMELDIPVEMYAPFNTPHVQLTPEYLGKVSKAQYEEEAKPKTRIEKGFIPILEVIHRLENIPYRWPIGRTALQKIAYFGTMMGLETGLVFKRASFGPFATDLKPKLTKLVNNGLLDEEKVGSKFNIRVGKTYINALNLFEKDYAKEEPIIERLTDLFCRLNTQTAELAATVHFARHTMKQKNGTKPSEMDVLNEVMEWKKRHRPPYDKKEVASTIRNLAVLGWLDVRPSSELDEETEMELVA